MKKISTEAVVSIIVVILFIGSIFGFALGGRPDSDVPTTDSNNPTNPDLNLPLEVYLGQIDANVLEIYPQIIVVGNSEIYDAEEVKSKFYEIDGIKSPTVNFNKDINGSIVAIVKIIIDPNKKDQTITKINDFNFIKEPEIYQMGLVSLPKKTIDLIGDNNKTKEYQFTIEKIEAILRIETFKKDQILAQIQIVFRGETPTQFLVLEAQNLSASPQMIFGEINSNLSAWLDSYTVSSKTIIDNNVSISEIKELFVDENLEVTTNYTESLEYMLAEDQNLDSLKVSLQNIKDVNNTIIKETQIDKNENKLIVNFVEDYTLEQYLLTKQEIGENLEGTPLIINKPTQQINLTFNTNDFNLEIINQNLETKDIEITTVTRLAEFDISEVTINNIDYTFEDKIATANLLWPEDENKNNFDLIVNAFAIRNKLLFAQLEEK
jgi:hypothetical protein